MFRIFAAIFLFIAVSLIAPVEALAEGNDAPIPTVAYTVGNERVLAPDWTRITWGNLPAIEESGWIKFPSNLVSAVGYDPSRAWQAGQQPSTFVMLGDMADVFGMQDFSMANVAEITGLNTKSLALGDLKLSNWQTIASFAKAIPGLENVPIDRIEPFYDLAKNFGGVAMGSTVGDIITSNPQLAQAALGDYLDLSGYSLDSVPGTEFTQFKDFMNWRESFISEVPGLGDVSWSDLPISPEMGLTPAAILARADLPWSEAEHGDPTVGARQFVSGSGEGSKTAIVPCEAGKPCSYLELSDLLGSLGPRHGQRWASGKTQMVEGGHGPLKAVNGGREPTGRMVYPIRIKVVLTQVDESKGSASFGLYLRACIKPVCDPKDPVCTDTIYVDLGCTPFFIGPLPWIPAKEKDLIILLSSDKAPKTNIPKQYQEQIASIMQQYAPQESMPDNSGSSSLCGKGLGGVDFQALAGAFSGIEGNYSSVGSYVNGGNGLWGRGLGRYQYMSYRSDVREIVKAKSGGNAFLAKVDSGATVSGAEMNQYFTPSDQDRVFKEDQTRNINQAMSEGFSGTRLIERVGQVHFGGAGAPIDGGDSDAHGRLTLYTYGKELAKNYQKAASKSGQTCPTDSTGYPIANGDGKTTGKFINPVGGNGTRYPITSGFGPRNIGCNRSKFHPAVDLGTPTGTPVKAADGGVVTFAGNVSGYGYTVVVDHGNGVKTRYSHLDSYGVQQGTSVSQGQVIAKSGNSDGNTGVSTGEHLDFGIYLNDRSGMGQLPVKGNAVDPRKYINF